MNDANTLRLREYLRHIIEAVRRIDEYVGDMSETSFLEDRKTQDAVIRNIEIIGEACNNIMKRHPGFADQHPQMPWGFAYEMRNVLSHGYFKVDLEIVWATIQKDLPELSQQVEGLLRQFRD